MHFNCLPKKKPREASSIKIGGWGALHTHAGKYRWDECLGRAPGTAHNDEVENKLNEHLRFMKSWELLSSCEGFKVYGSFSVFCVWETGSRHLSMNVLDWWGKHRQLGGTQANFLFDIVKELFDILRYELRKFLIFAGVLIESFPRSSKPLQSIEQHYLDQEITAT